MSTRFSVKICWTRLKFRIAAKHNNTIYCILQTHVLFRPQKLHWLLSFLQHYHMTRDKILIKKLKSHIYIIFYIWICFWKSIFLLQILIHTISYKDKKINKNLLNDNLVICTFKIGPIKYLFHNYGWIIILATCDDWSAEIIAINHWCEQSKPKI